METVQKSTCSEEAVFSGKLHVGFNVPHLMAGGKNQTLILFIRVHIQNSNPSTALNSVLRHKLTGYTMGPYKLRIFLNTIS